MWARFFCSVGPLFAVVWRVYPVLTEVCNCQGVPDNYKLNGSWLAEKKLASDNFICQSAQCICICIYIYICTRSHLRTFTYIYIYMGLSFASVNIYSNSNSSILVCMRAYAWKGADHEITHWQKQKKVITSTYTCTCTYTSTCIYCILLTMSTYVATVFSCLRCTEAALQLCTCFWSFNFVCTYITHVWSERQLIAL